MRISKKGFVEAIKTFWEDPQNEVQEDIHARILVAAGFIIRQQRGISEEEVWSPTPTEVADFLDGLQNGQGACLTESYPRTEGRPWDMCHARPPSCPFRAHGHRV
jgi:hypothetical protein